MLQQRRKKGFTLAELLIVVAIIAVLTAIAVPLFVTALNNAEKRVGEANCRAIRGLAISEILSNVPAEKLTSEKVFWGYGEINQKGEVTKLGYFVGADTEVKKLTDWKLNDLNAEGATAFGDAAYQKVGSDYYVLVKITPSEITEATVPSVVPGP